MDTEVDREIVLVDDQTNISYIINISPASAEKARNDSAYATKLLERAKRRVQQESQQRENDAQQTQSSCEVEATHNWTHDETTILLAAYQNNLELFNNEKRARSDCWAEVAKEVATVLKKKNIPPVPVKKCISKMESLKRHYKSVKDHNKKSGNSRRTWVYLNMMDEIFASKPWIQPISTAGSDVVDRQDITSSSAKRPRNSNQSLLLKMLENKQEAEKRREAQRKARHEEKMQILYSLTNAVQLLVKENSDNKDSVASTKNLLSDVPCNILDRMESDSSIDYDADDFYKKIE